MGRGIGVDPAGNSYVTGEYQGTANFGAFTLISAGARDIFVAKFASPCGNGILDPGEECDDGNTVFGDGCDENCRFDLGACCLGTACSITTETDCFDSGGTFFGFNSTCDAPDTDGDGLRDECDGCPDDGNKIEPGICGCNVDDDADSDGDGVPDCDDECPGVDDAVFAPGCKNAIPTVSEWGLIVMALLLLAGAKVYFNRRRPHSGFKAASPPARA